MMVYLCIYLFITKAHPYHFAASLSPEVCFLNHWINVEERINRCDRTYHPQSGSKLTQMAKEGILTLGCGFSFVCACNSVKSLKRCGRRKLLFLCPFLKWLRNIADVIPYRRCILWCAGLVLHSSEAFSQLTEFYGHNSELFEKNYLTDYSYVTIWIFG